MEFVEFTAKTVDDAITAACRKFLVTSDKLEYEVIEEGSTGFLGFNAKPAKIRAKVKGSVEDTAREFLNDVFAAMKMTVVVDVKFDETDGFLDIDLSGDDMGVLIGKRGQTLDSLQYLVSLVVNKEAEEYIRVKVDTENYRKRRKETLENLAKNIAYKVKRTKRSVSLEPMNPYERRIIHSNLQDSETVTTYSVGSEPYRKVVIAPKNAKPYGKGGYKKDGYKKRGPKPHRNHSDKPVAEKTGSYTTTYKADFKPQQHKAEYKNFEDYLAAVSYTHLTLPTTSRV